MFAVYINTYYNGKLFGMGIYSQFKDYSRYLVMSIITCLPAYAITFLPLPNIIILIMASVISIVSYWFLLRKDPVMKEVVHMIGSKFHKHSDNVGQ